MSMKTWIQTIKPFGAVLEIGVASQNLEGFSVQNHTKITDWETQLSKLGIFDTILLHIDLKASEQSTHLLDQGKKTIEQVNAALPSLSSIRYTDADLDMLCQQIGASQKEHLATFLFELQTNGQISHHQYDSMCKKYHLEKKEGKKLKQAPLIECVLQCVKHLRKGGHFSCLLGSHSPSKDPDFSKQIASNPHLDYRELPCQEGHFLIIEKLS